MTSAEADLAGSGRRAPRSGALPTRQIRMRDFAWVTWRQHEALLVTSGVIALLAAAALLALDVAVSSAVGACAAAAADSCLAARHPLSVDVAQGGLRAVALVIPVLVGAFWGAPLVAREYEGGTDVVAWGQDVSATRWLLAKTAVLAAAVVVLSAGVAVAAGRLAATLLALRPGAAFATNFAPVPFETTSLLLVAYSVAALAVGVAAGTIARRVLPAIAVTVAVVAAARLGVAGMLRPRFSTPLRAFAPVDSAGPAIPADALVLVENGWSNGARQVVAFPRQCVTAADWEACLQQHGVAERVTVYQPPDRLVLFQWLEAAVFLGVAAAALLVAYWVLARRTAAR